MKKEFEGMSVAELRKIATERNSKGNFTDRANNAYAAIQELTHAQASIGRGHSTSSIYTADLNYYGRVME